MRAAIILAGGSGTRMKNGLKKEFLRLNSCSNKTVIESSLNRFIESGLFDKIVIVTREDLLSETTTLLLEYKSEIEICSGGLTRQNSVFNGLKLLNQGNIKPKSVLIHDGARPWVDLKTIQNVVKGISEHQAVIAVEPSTNAMKIINNKNKITQHLKREDTWCAQTPQGFLFNDLYNWHLKADKAGLDFIDDSMLAAHFGQDIYIVEGSNKNRKVTYLEDIEKDMQEEIRIGQGWDRHRLSRDNKLIIGGCKIESELGTIAHSDGDVLIHAIIDSILGACSLGDIGTHFPPSDNRWKNVNSMNLLKETLLLISNSGCTIGNIDSTIVLEKPKLRTYIKTMRQNLSKVLNIPIEDISIKAKTAEEVDSVGQGLAIEAQAITLVRRQRSTN